MTDLDEIKAVFPDAEIIQIDAGPIVLCDLCDADYTFRKETGGFLFQSKAVCPECAPRFEKQINQYQEQHLIRKRCPEGKPFADWVREDLR